MPLTSKSEKKIYFYDQMFNWSCVKLLTMQILMTVFVAVMIYEGTGDTMLNFISILIDVMMIVGMILVNIPLMILYIILSLWLMSDFVACHTAWVSRILELAAKGTCNQRVLHQQLMISVLLLFFNIYFLKTMFAVVYYAMKLRYWTKKEKYDKMLAKISPIV